MFYLLMAMNYVPAQYLFTAQGKLEYIFVLIEKQLKTASKFSSQYRYYL